MRRRGGFSLGEILVSFLILTLVMVAIIVMIPMVLGGINQASQRAQASQLARKTLEQLRVFGAQNMRLTGTVPITEPSMVVAGVTFDSEYRVTESTYGTPPTPLPRDPYINDPTNSRNYLAYQVEVTIRWMSVKGPKSLKICSDVTRSL